MPSVKAELNGINYINWLIIKAKIGNGHEISNSDTLKRLMEYYNRKNGSKLI